MILVIDNYDSFTYNIVDYMGRLTEDTLEVFRHDKISIDDIKAKNPTHIVISPGPKEPKDAGISKEVIRVFGQTIPILGVCLGHQCIAEVFGDKIVRAKRLMHGKTSMVTIIKPSPIFKNIPNPFKATRYHSLVIDKQCLPECLKVTAVSEDDDEIMAVQHKIFPIYGVQFHPESICSPEGLTLIDNFLHRLV